MNEMEPSSSHRTTPLHLNNNSLPSSHNGRRFSPYLHLGGNGSPSSNPPTPTRRIKEPPPSLLITEQMMVHSHSSSASLTPPNSNSNTTLSCGSGNSTSANIGVPPATSTPIANPHNHNHHHQKTMKGRSMEDDTDIIIQLPPKKGMEGEEEEQEFLPICDALFNLISLAAYFTHLTFDLLTVYTWWAGTEGEDEQQEDELSPQQQERKRWVWPALSAILLSAVLCQVLSFIWFRQSRKRGQVGPRGEELEGPPAPCSTLPLILLHLSFSGVLWRYFKLFIPVHLRFVKNEVRDLCLLRLVHAFCEGVPILLIQLYLIWGTGSRAEVTDFTVVATSLSLFSVCWALASFSKNVRRENVHRLVLTWVGVIFQFAWHLGTVTARVVALSLYASVYGGWVFLVLGMHWGCVLLWLISPLEEGRKSPSFSALLAVVYTFCYVNVEEARSRGKVVAYYVTMFLENALLLSVWLLAKRYEDEIWYKRDVILAVFLPFLAGILFMTLYYRFFHIKRLSYGTEEEEEEEERNNNMGPEVGGRRGRLSESGGGAVGGVVGVGGALVVPKKKERSYYGVSADKFLMNGPQSHHHHPPVPTGGVFNCRLHPAMKRKKKKPTSFVPPPATHHHLPPLPSPGPPSSLPSSSGSQSPALFPHHQGRGSQPFWKRARLSVSENEGGSLGSRVDIQQKLEEKKKQQLAELKEIEEEIKQGKLQRPQAQSPLTASVPGEKKRPWCEESAPPLLIYPRPDPNGNRVILDPREYLMYSHPHSDCPFYDNPDWAHLYEPEPEYGNGESGGSRGGGESESGLSLPTSYTLPREFKYKRKGRNKALPKDPAQVVPSTNSSDGDVDSGEEDPEIYGTFGPYPLPLPQPASAPQPSKNRKKLHETKL